MNSKVVSYDVGLELVFRGISEASRFEYVRHVAILPVKLWFVIGILFFSCLVRWYLYECEERAHSKLEFEKTASGRAALEAIEWGGM